jgi:hypothetical protein
MLQNAHLRAKRRTSGKSHRWRQIVRQQASRAARPRDIEDAVDDFAHRLLARPLCVGQIGLVSGDNAAMLSSSS